YSSTYGLDYCASMKRHHRLTFILAALCSMLAIGFLNAQTRAPLRFEVASIKPAQNAGRGGMELLPGGGLRMDGVTLESLIGLAYDVRPDRISGGPKWVQTEAYAILAKAERSDPDQAPNVGTTTPAAYDQMRERMRSLLAERFRLVVRTVSKE